MGGGSGGGGSGVHCLVIVYLILATDITNGGGGNNYHGGPTSTTVSSSTTTTPTTPVSSSVVARLSSSNAPPTFASRNNSRYMGLTTTSTFTSSSVAATPTTATTKSTSTTSTNATPSLSTPTTLSNSISNTPTSSTSRDRDNKLMSVLQARRSALTIPSRDARWRDKQAKDIANGRGASPCDRQCSNEARFTSRECLRNCLNTNDGGGYQGSGRHQSRHNNYNQTRHSNIVMSVRNSNRNRNQDESTPEMNLITNVQDELLEVDESIKGEILVHPQASAGGNSNNSRKSSQNNFNSQPTKETVRSSYNKTDNNRKKPSKYEPISNAVESSRTPSSTTVKTAFYEFQTKLSDRTPRIQNKVANNATEVRFPEDNGSFTYYGQKLPTKSNTETRNQVPEHRRSKLKPDPLQIVIETLPKTSSTEKSRTWNNRHPASRNVVVYNNYLRRMNPHFESSTSRSPADISSTTEYVVLKYQTNHSELRGSLKLKSPPVNVTSSTMASVYNLAEGEADKKIVHSRSAENVTEPEKIHLGADSQIVTQKTLPTKTVQVLTTSDKASIFMPSKRPSLIISIPENATPEGVYYSETKSPIDSASFRSRGTNVYNPLYYHTGTTEPISPHTEIVRITEANNLYLEDSRNHVSIPDINHIFRNISSYSTTAVEPSRETVIVVVPGPISSSTSKSVSRTTISTSVKSTINPQDDVTTTTARPKLFTDTGQRPSIRPFYTTTTRTTAKTTTTTSTTRTSTTVTTTPSPTTKRTTTTAKPIVKATPTVQLDTSLNTPFETTKISKFEDPMDDSNFKPILSSIFPNLSNTTPNTISDVNFSVFMASPDTTGQILKSPKTDGILLTDDNDVMIEMHKMNTATLVLAALGMLPVVVILMYGVRTIVIRRKHKAQHDLERYISDGQPISPVVKLEQSETSSTTTESIMSDKDFDRSNLRFKSLLGEGNFGQVWKAEADDLAGHLGTTRIVAVKTERVDNGQGGLKAEAEIMKKLGSHPNVVTLLGACTEQEPHLLIMEFAMRGRLLSLLRAARSAINEVTVKRTPVMPLSLRRLTGFAHDIARGMEYISDKKIVHRDLAARNVLLDHNGICKICDFGMSVDLDKVATSHSEMRIPRLHQSEPRFNFEFAGRTFGTRSNRHTLSNCRTSRPALPIRWMAPEALQYHMYSPETDVWAFGIVIWEIATLGCTPYPNLSGREVVRNIPNGVRPEIPPDCRPELYELMNRTWRKDPRHRPTFAEARMSLARALCQWKPDDNIPATGSEYFDVSGFSEDLEHGMVYFNKRVSEFECEI